MQPVHLDFESFSECDLRACGAFRYAQDPSTEVLIAGYAFGAGAVQVQRWDQGFAFDFCPDDLAEHVARGGIFMAHNAQFEYVIWTYVLVARHGWPRVPPEQWYCTAAHAASLSLPRSLEGAGAAARVAVQKDKEGSRLIRVFCIPRKPTKKNPSTRILPTDSPEEFERFVQYNITDVESERALENKLPPMNPREMNVWRYDLRINERGIPIDVPLVHRALKVVNELTADIDKQTRDLTATPAQPEGIAPTQVAKLLGFIQENGGDVLFTLQRKEIEEKMKLTQFGDKADALLQLRMEAARVSTKKLVSMLNVCGEDNRARGTLLYHGATTGRFSGRLIQPHNFVRGTYKQSQRDIVVNLLERYGSEELHLLFPRPMEAISNIMRAFICAPDGRILFVVDYSAIEARILVWLAGQDDVVAMYFAGRDTYKWMAGMIFGIDEHGIDEDTQEGFEQRRLGKHIMLGGGYGMGVPKFISTCKNIGGFDVSETIAQLGIDTFRATHDKVKKAWKIIEKAAVECVRSGKTLAVLQGRITFWMWGEDDFNFLFTRLPSGRSIAYPYPKLFPGMYGEQLTYLAENHTTHQWDRESTYGGKLVENAIQGIARDIMLCGMVGSEKAGYEIVGTVHDELIAIRDEGTGNLKEYEALVSVLPAWAAGCPITAKGFTAKRWRKG